jgi:hypothetical protein
METTGNISGRNDLRCAIFVTVGSALAMLILTAAREPFESSASSALGPNYPIKKTMDAFGLGLSATVVGGCGIVAMLSLDAVGYNRGWIVAVTLPISALSATVSVLAMACVVITQFRFFAK